ncbi:MAG: hypothetical protein WAL25_08570 [Acidimicrobiia bacterium]
MPRREAFAFWESYMLADNRHMDRLPPRLGRRVGLVIASGMSSAVYELAYPGPLVVEL